MHRPYGRGPCVPCLPKARQQLLFQLIWLHGLPKALVHLSVPPNHELGEVPFDVATGRPRELGALEKAVHGLRMRPVHIRSLHQR